MEYKLDNGEIIKVVTSMEDPENCFYRHFKGTIYEVKAVAEHTETGKLFIIYCNKEKPEKIWARPIEMFTSKVDKEKYPDVKQEQRFEYIEK
jgi:hypothetical protein